MTCTQVYYDLSYRQSDAQRRCLRGCPSWERTLALNGPPMARSLYGTGAHGLRPHGSEPLTCRFSVERVTRIELALSAWEADVLPLNYTRRANWLPRNTGSGRGPGLPAMVPDATCHP